MGQRDAAAKSGDSRAGVGPLSPKLPAPCAELSLGLVLRPSHRREGAGEVGVADRQFVAERGVGGVLVGQARAAAPVPLRGTPSPTPSACP